jgi:hypothetical protein
MARDDFPGPEAARMTDVGHVGVPVMRFVNPRRELLGVTQALVAFMRSGPGPRIVMVSGIEGGEGATTIAWNLARAVADEFSGRVCLVRLAEEAGPPVEAPPGRSGGGDVIAATLSRRDLNAALEHGLRDSLPKLPVEPLFYLVDGPPLLGSVEAYRLCDAVDGLVLVAEAERTTSATLDAARAAAAGCRCRLIGAVLNKRRRRLPRFLVSLLGGEFRPRAALSGALVDGAPDRLR